MTGNIVPRGTRADVGSPEAQLLRAYIERQSSGNSVILVTSAKDGDGKSLTACSLADSLARAGRRTALVDTTTRASEDLRLPSPTRSGILSDLAVYVPLPKPPTPRTREETLQFVEEMRSSHEFTIVDSGALLSSDMAMAFAGVVDGVLLSVCLGRPPSEEDELTVRFLNHTGSKVLGVVAASPKAIAQFNRRVPSSSPKASTAGKTAIPNSRALRRVLVGVIAAIALTLGAFEYGLGHAHGTEGASASTNVGGISPQRTTSDSPAKLQ